MYHNGCDKKIMTLREGQIMKIHYMTAVAALFVVAVHIIIRLLVPFGVSLEYQNVLANYHNIAYAVLLESILILIAIHGFNGLRVILIELRQNRRWEDGVTIFIIAATTIIIAYGTRTIVMVNGFGFG